MLGGLPLLVVGASSCMHAPTAAKRAMLSSTRLMRLASTSSTQASRMLSIAALARRSLTPFPQPRSSSLRSLGGARAIFSSSISRNNTTPPAATANQTGTVLATYEGPLARTFTRLKIFSLGSLGLASVLTPVLLLAPGEISMAGRVGLCITALATSGVSTALIAWIGTPYVGSMRLLRQPSKKEQGGKVVMELNTVSWRLRPQRTLVYEPTFLRPTSRPFAAWELTNNPPPLAQTGQQAGKEEVEKKVAETFDVKSGKSMGQWCVKYSTSTQTKDPSTQANEAANWKLNGKVQVKEKPTRYFNVHEELLDEDWQVLG